MKKRVSYRMLLVAIALALTLQPIAAHAAVRSAVSEAGSPLGTMAKRTSEKAVPAAPVTTAGEVSPLASDDDIPGVPLPLTSPFTGSLNEDTDYEDIYSVNLAAGQKFIFWISGPAGSDFGLTLYGPAGWEDEVAMAWGETYPYGGSYVVPSGKGGTYYLDASSWWGSGTYTITYSIVAAEANDTFPGVAIPDSPVADTLAVVTDDTDIYSIDLAAGKKIKFSVTADADTDFFPVLFGPGGMDDERVWAWGETYPYAGTYVVPLGKGGKYYIGLFADAGSGDYTLTYSVTDAEPDDFIPGVPLPSSPATGHLDVTDDSADIYSVPLVQGQRISASLTTDTAVPSDFDMLVFGPGATDAYTDDAVAWAFGETYPETITFTAPAAGTYYLMVNAYSGADDYELAYTLGMAPPTTFQKVQGADRYTTAIAASKQAFPTGAGCVVIATGANWPDALGGAALAAAKDAPILLTRPGALPAEVKAEIKRLGATEAIVLGASSAVSDAVYREVDALVGTVTRIGGKNRYDTAALIARKVVAVNPKFFSGSCFLATGANFPDALGASPISAAMGMPILLVSPNGLPAETKKAMLDLEVYDVVVLGSDDAVSSEVFEEISDLDAIGERIEGRNRYETAAKVAEYAVEQFEMTYDNVAIATGENFPDALAAGVMQGKDGSVMLLTRCASLDGYAAAALRANKWGIDNVRYMGSTSAVSSATRTSVQGILKKY